METNPFLRIEIKNSQPFELIDLTKSFLSASAEYKRFVSRNYKTTKKEETFLYIREIKSGSTIVDLISITLPILPLLGTQESVTTIIQFGFH